MNPEILYRLSSRHRHSTSLRNIQSNISLDFGCTILTGVYEQNVIGVIISNELYKWNKHADKLTKTTNKQFPW